MMTRLLITQLEPMCAHRHGASNQTCIVYGVATPRAEKLLHSYNFYKLICKRRIGWVSISLSPDGDADRASGAGALVGDGVGCPNMRSTRTTSLSRSSRLVSKSQIRILSS